MKLTIAFAILLIATNSKANQIFPGTSSRPILSANEAAGYTIASYLQGWSPESISTTKADFTVGGNGNIATIQAAVNLAIRKNSTTRQYIKINQGKYPQVVYIPPTKVPLTLYGTGAPSATVISLGISATSTRTQYQTIVSRFFAVGDPAHSFFMACANRTQIGTSCSSVVRVDADDVELINLTIENSSKLNGTDQAVALKIDADRVQVRNSRLLGHQDTLYVGKDTSKILRNYFEAVYMEGDTDFVFGAASAVFNKCTFHVRDDRKQFAAVIFAPSTPQLNNFGFLVIAGTITGDSSWHTSLRVRLARNWDVEETSRNGQLVIRETQMDLIFPVAAPYAASTSGKPYSGNATIGRNLNDVNFNRFWEYMNTGAAA